jgi:hypothetical protein
MAPQRDKPADRPSPPAQSMDFAQGDFAGGLNLRDLLGPLDEPFDQHARLGVSQPAGQSVIV